MGPPGAGGDVTGETMIVIAGLGTGLGVPKLFPLIVIDGLGSGDGVTVAVNVVVGALVGGCTQVSTSGGQSAARTAGAARKSAVTKMVEAAREIWVVRFIRDPKPSPHHVR